MTENRLRVLIVLYENAPNIYVYALYNNNTTATARRFLTIERRW